MPLLCCGNGLGVGDVELGRGHGPIHPG
jgi:hypothetical protein